MGEHSSISAKIRELRENLNLSEKDVATRIGLDIHWYCDIEAYEDEVFSNVSIAHLASIAAVLEVSLSKLILGNCASSSTKINFAELTNCLSRKFQESKLSIDAFSESVGWELKDAIIDPEVF